MRSPTEPKGIRRPGFLHLAVVIAYALLTVVMTWPLARHVVSAIPGDGFDGWQNYWNLWWLKTALVDRLTNPFITDILYAPTGAGLYFHTLNPLNGLLSMPVQLASGLIPAYNSVVLISWVLSGYGTFLLCLWLLKPSSRNIGRHSHAERGEASHATDAETLHYAHDDSLASESSQILLPAASDAEDGVRQPTQTDASTERLARTAGAFLAGVIFAFAPFHMAHLLGHMQVMSLQWIPFYVLFLLRGISAKRNGKQWLHDGLLAGLFLIFNGLSDWYFVLYLFLFTGLAVVYAWLASVVRMRADGSADARRVVRSLVDVLATPLVAGIVFLVVLSPVLLPMVREATQHSFMVRPATDLFILSASIMDYIIPSRMHTLLREGGQLLPGNQIAPVSERTIAAGYAVIALVIVAVALQRRRAAFWVFAAFFFLLLSLGPKMHLGNIGWESVPLQGGTEIVEDAETASWTLFGVLNRSIPFMRISRSVSRYALMVQLSAAILAGLGLHALLRRMRRGAAIALAAVALAAVLFEFWVAPYPLSEPDTPEFYTDLATRDGSAAVLNLPMNYDRPGYLLYQTVHGRPLTVAYISRDDPRTLTERMPVLQHLRHLGPDITGDDPMQVGMTVLNDLGVQYVVLDRYKMPGGEERAYTEGLAAAIFAGQEPLHEDERLTVYEVRASEASVPYIELGPLNWRLLQSGDGLEDAQSRAVGEGPACVTVRHANGNAAVLIDYETEEGAEASISGSSGAILTILEPALNGATITVELGDADHIGADAVFCLQAAEPDTVRVQQMQLAP